jgi:hypothetical protein
VLEFSYSIKSPRDSASGQATGKRRHSPFRITIEFVARRGVASTPHSTVRIGCLFLVLASVACNRVSAGDDDSAEESGTDGVTESSGDPTSTSTTDGRESSGEDSGTTGDTEEPFMPIGIPEPEFGIHDVTPALPSPWDEPIPLAYYVDDTHPDATSDDTATGTPDAPRSTIPSSLPAGSTVFIAGGPYPGISLSATGTADAPIFITAADPSAPPVVAGYVGISGSFLVVEHLDIAGPEAGVGIATPSDHIAIRHCEIHDGEGGGSGLYTGRWDPEDDPAVAQHIVFYDNSIHDNGNLAADFDEDHHGISLGHHAEHVWIIDNEMARNSGDGLQVNAKKAYLAETLHHVWVGRNVTHENKQTGLWTKQATDVVFSQNVVYGHRPSNSSDGACIGFQYGPERVWIMFNLLYDCEIGITSSTSVGDEDDVAGSGQDVYILGNVILGIHKSDGSGASEDPWQLGAGIRFTDESATKHVAFNTVFDVDVAFTYARGVGGVELGDNIFVGSQGMAINIETQGAASASSVDRILLDAGATIGWGDAGVVDLAGFQGTGQCDACIVGDPMFVDAMMGDVHLQSSSPAVDAGAPSELVSIYEQLYGEPIDVDIERSPRTAGAAPDVGALELGAD